MIFLVFLAMAAVLLVFAVLLFRSGFSTTSIIWRILLCGFALTAALGFAYLAYVVFWPASAWQSELVANLPGGKGSLIAVALAGISAVIALFMLLVAYNIWAGRYIGFGRARRLGHAFTALAASIATVLFAWYYVPGGAYSIAWLSHPFGSASSTDNTSGVIEVADSTSIRSEPAGKSSVFNSNEVVRLETQLNSEQERVGSLEVQIEELEKKLTSSQTNLKDVNAALARVETERDEGRTKIVQLQNEITGIKQRMNELKQHSEADVAARLKEKDAALESLRVQLKQRQEKNTVIASLRDQHKQTAMERDDLKQLLATRQSEIDEAKTTIASLRAEKNTQSNITNAESSKIADESSRRIAALETQVKELRRIRDNLNHQVERKEASLVAGEQRISELESEARALRTRHGELDTYRDDVDARMRALRVQLTEETQATALLDDENAALLAKNKRLKTETEKLRREHSLLQDAVDQERRSSLTRLTKNLRSEWELTSVAMERIEGKDRRTGFKAPSSPREALEQFEAENQTVRLLLEKLSPRADLSDLRKKFATGFSTEDYDVQVFPSNELIDGQRGRYYLIDFKNAEADQRFYFPPGKYTLGRSNTAFVRALSGFVSSVLDKIKGRADYHLFVRGSADNTPFRGRMDPANPFTMVRYMEKVGDDRFGPSVKQHKFSNVIRNNDLPNLRAAFLQKVVSTVYPVNPPVILEGDVTEKRDAQDRSVSLVLYVDW